MTHRLSQSWVLSLAILFALPSQTEAIHPERWYAERAAEEYGGSLDVPMPDGTLCDIITARHAIEVEFARNWREALGQSLNCAFQSGRIAGILLIVVEPKEERYVEGLRTVIDHYDLLIDVRVIRTWADSGWADSGWL